MKGSVINKREKKYIKALQKFRENAGTELASQAKAVSDFTGLSLDFCAKMVLYRLQRRMGP